MIVAEVVLYHIIVDGEDLEVLMEVSLRVTYSTRSIMGAA